VIARLLVVGLAAAALTGCGGGSNGSATTTSAGPVTIEIDVKGGKPVGGIRRATAQKGQTVTIVVHSDVADEVHLHGYDLHRDVEADGTARIRFTASITGSFEAELENRGLQILDLTVR
jgi:hypothetical protein